MKFTIGSKNTKENNLAYQSEKIQKKAIATNILINNQIKFQ